jgi:hypothetical protein
MYITPSTASTSTPSILIGVGAVDMGSGTNSTAVGNAASAEITAVAVGANATAYSYSTAIGPNASAMYDSSTAIGNGAAATAANQMVLGGTSVTETYLRGAIYVGSGLTYAGVAGQVLTSNGPSAAPNWGDLPTALSQLTNDTGFITNAGSILGNAATATQASMLVTTNWSVKEDSGVLYFKYNGVNKAKLDSSGNLTVVGNITAYGTV